MTDFSNRAYEFHIKFLTTTLDNLLLDRSTGRVPDGGNAEYVDG